MIAATVVTVGAWLAVFVALAALVMATATAYDDHQLFQTRRTARRLLACLVAWLGVVVIVWELTGGAL